MRRIEDSYDLHDRIRMASLGDGPAAAVALARRLLADPTLLPATLRGEAMIQLGEYLVIDGDAAAAEAPLRDAVALDDSSDARAALISWCLEHGDEDEAYELARTVMRTRPRDGTVYVLIGESFEMFGDMVAALRWFTAGLLRADDDFAEEQLAISRLRIRTNQGLPHDEWDENALDVLEEQRDARQRSERG